MHVTDVPRCRTRGRCDGGLMSGFRVNRSLPRPPNPETGRQKACHCYVDICLIFSYILRIISLVKDAFGR